MRDQPYHANALVLWNYSCPKSRRTAHAFAAALDNQDYGYLKLDWDHEGRLPVGQDGLGRDRWFKAIRRWLATVPATVVLVSRHMNSASRDDIRGMGLMREMIHLAEFRISEDEAQRPRCHVIPIAIDCRLADLRARAGEYEQLQDITVPFLRANICLHYKSSWLQRSDKQAAFLRRLADRIANPRRPQSIRWAEIVNRRSPIPFDT